MASGPITSWEIDGEAVETVSDFIFGGSQITVDGDCSHEMNQTVLAKAIHTPDRDPGPLEGTMAGSWSLGIVEQSQGKRCCGLRRDGSRGCEGGDCGGKCLWRKARQPWKQGDTAESRVGCGAITIASLSPQESISS